MKENILIKAGDLVSVSHNALKRIGIVVTVESRNIFDDTDNICEVLFVGSAYKEKFLGSCLERYNPRC